MTRTAITTIPFHGANILVRAGDTPETTMVAMKPVVEGIGLSWQGQHEKIVKHPVLSQGIKEILIPSAGGEQAMTALPLNRLHFWLATLQPNKIKDSEIRDRVIVYQIEAADVLFDHFFGRAIGHSDDQSDRQFGIAKMTISKVKGIEGKLLSLEGRIDNLLLGVNAKVAALDYVSVRELLEEAKAIQKRRGRVNRKIGYELRDRALVAGPPSPCRRCPHSGVWLFQRDFADRYMKDRGNNLVLEHNERQSGQQVILFPVVGKQPEGRRH